MRNGAKKLRKSREGSTQGRLDMFFKPVASPTTAIKRKVRRLLGELCTLHVITIQGTDSKGPLKKKSKTASTGSKFKRK